MKKATVIVLGIIALLALVAAALVHFGSADPKKQPAKPKQDPEPKPEPDPEPEEEEETEEVPFEEVPEENLPGA